MDKIVVILTIGYGIGAVAGLFFGVTSTFWLGFFVFWIGGAVATLAVAVAFRIWLGKDRPARDDDSSAKMELMRDAGIPDTPETGRRTLKGAANWGRGQAAQRTAGIDAFDCKQCREDALNSKRSKTTSTY